jgi:hypothetical protein
MILFDWQVSAFNRPVFRAGARDHNDRHCLCGPHALEHVYGPAYVDVDGLTRLFK